MQAVSLSVTVACGLLLSCTVSDPKECRGAILDLEFDSTSIKPNPITSYLTTAGFRTVTDSLALLRYEDAGRVAILLQPSKTNPVQRRFEYKVLEGIIRMPNYQWDLLAVVDRNESSENVQYWLKGYDNKRSQVGHLDFASWSDQEIISGRIDCDSTLHLILPERNEHRTFRIDENGKNELVSRTKIIER